MTKPQPQPGPEATVAARDIVQMDGGAACLLEGAAAGPGAALGGGVRISERNIPAGSLSNGEQNPAFLLLSLPWVKGPSC